MEYVVVLVVPLFLFFLYLEYYFTKKKNVEVYKYESSVANISIGIAERFFNLFVASSFYSVFVWVYENYALFSIEVTWYTAVLLLLVADFVWYWYHRLGHQINIFWAAHIVHHHSEEFNFTAATRITTIQALIRTPFWCVMPLLGFHPKQVLGVLVFHGMYSFFTHTQWFTCPKWIEKVFITPSLHGVHHASNEKYLDKNFGDVFVFWDKIFGTFQKEEEKPVYGITHSLNRYSFLWQHFHYYLEIAVAVKKETSLKGKLKMIFGNPSVMNQDWRPKIEKYFFKDEKRSNLSANLKYYVSFQLLFALSLLSFFTIKYNATDAIERFVFTGILILTLINIGALLEQRKWIYYLENARIFFFSLMFSYYLENWAIIIVVFFATLILCANENYKKWYLQSFLKYDIM